MSLSVGVLGFGRMGGPIAGRLIGAGNTVSVFDTRDSASAAATAIGARAAQSATALAANVDILITVLPGPKELRSAMIDDATLVSMRTKTLWIDMTSGDPADSGNFGARARLAGVEMVSAPMGGGPKDARNGTLTFYVDGDTEAVARCRPVLEALAEAHDIHWVGAEKGHAQMTKLLANLLWFGQAAAVTEALLVGQAMGLDPVRLRDTLSHSAGTSRFLEESTDALFAGDYLESFSISRCLEELETLSRIANRSASPFSISSAVTSLYREAVDEFGGSDGELLVSKLLEERAGRSLRSEGPA
jgi:3-hydroxyisobutyrate dehydrogenase